MRMCSYYRIDTMQIEKVTPPLLLIGNVKMVLFSPVRSCDNKLGSTLFRSFDYHGHMSRIQQIYYVRLRNGISIYTVGKVDKGNPYATYIHDKRVVMLLIFHRWIKSGICHIHPLVECVCAVKSPFPFVADMVVCRQKQIDAAFAGLYGQGIGCGECRISGKGLYTCRKFHVCDHQIRRIQLWLYIFEVGAEVVGV